MEKIILFLILSVSMFGQSVNRAPSWYYLQTGKLVPLSVGDSISNISNITFTGWLKQNGTADNYLMGKLGIGTAVPGNLLHVYADAATVVPLARLQQANTGGYATLQIDRASTARIVATSYSTGGTDEWYTGELYNGGSSNTKFSIATGNALSDSKVTVQTDGNIGINTPTPYAQYSQVGATPIMYLTDSDVNTNRTSLATATDTSSIKFDASATQPTITVKNTTGTGFTLASVAGGGASFDNSIMIIDSLLGRNEKSSLADDGTITLATGVSGWGEAMIGDNQEWASFRFSADGTVTLISNTANTVNTDTDTKFCIYDAGSGVVIKNALGSRLTCAVNVHYYIP